MIFLLTADREYQRTETLKESLTGKAHSTKLVFMKVTQQKLDTRITQQELDSLQAATCEDEWNRICDTIQSDRNGEYPDDWFEKVMLSGMMGDVSGRF